MNKFLILILIVLFAAGCSSEGLEVKSEGIEVNKLEKRSSIFFKVNSDTPYSGKVFENYENGQKKEKTNYKDGKLDGLKTTWYENGQKKSECNYKDGELDGLLTYWFENGQKKSEGNTKGRSYDGLHTTWHENGQKKSEAKYENRNLDGLTYSWDKNGKMTEWCFYKDGEVIKIRSY